MGDLLTFHFRQKPYILVIPTRLVGSSFGHCLLQLIILVYVSVKGGCRELRRDIFVLIELRARMGDRVICQVGDNRRYALWDVYGWKSEKGKEVSIPADGIYLCPLYCTCKPRK